MNTSLLPPPRLTRGTATVPLGAPSGLGEGTSPSASRHLVRQVLQAYANLPFKGPALVLPGDVVAVQDTWLAALEDELQDREDAGLSAVQAFSLEAWLKAKVDVDGSASQRAQLRALIARLPEPPVAGRPELLDDGFYSNGLPADIMAVMHQPLVEIPVYRDLADLPVGADDTPRPSEAESGGREGSPEEEDDSQDGPSGSH